ncbi:MAG: 16S rRNA (guanine(966)-N(2))-methyltransferase RsmD [Lachnospiraceae bacterium]|nr:16S rRNA (guanine(966)-N(2))-methyltransferase RsmD [Lachnospiraceae bacterium]
MRVIAGTRRSIPLVTVDGLDTRPTTDRIKETLFNILQTEIAGARFLDLFAGSGQMGIEALSRGASYAVFAEQNKKCVECIKQNLTKTKFLEESKVIASSLPDCLKVLATDEPFDIIFLDPPYASNLEPAVLSMIDQLELADANTTIIIEAALDRDVSFVETTNFTVVRTKEYKTNKHVFLRRK